MDNIQQKFANVQFTAPTHRNNTVEAQHAAIGEVASKVNLRKVIKQAKKDPWVFKR